MAIINNSKINLFLLQLLQLLNLTLLHQDTANFEFKWLQFTHNFHKNYSLIREEPERQKIFNESLKFITNHNRKFQDSLITYDLSINHFADLTSQEYVRKYLFHYNNNNSYEAHRKHSDNQTLEMLNLIKKTRIEKIIQRRTKLHQILPRTDLPDTKNWLKYNGEDDGSGWRNKISSQEPNCKSSYVLASINTMEAHYYIKHGKLIQLSGEDVLNCGRLMGNFGCMGGFIERVYQYGMLFGIGSSSRSSRSSSSLNNLKGTSSTQNNGMCRNERENFYIKKIYISSLPSSTSSSSSSSESNAESVSLNINRNNNDEKFDDNELAMQQAIAFYGPVTAAIDASLDTFRFYRGGLYYDSRCSSMLNETNHFVTVLGYGKMSNNDNDDGKEYWLIRNSYGTDWGINGYMYLARNLKNHCGIGSYFVYPEVS